MQPITYAPALLLLLGIVQSAPTEDIKTLELIHVFFRHGDRTPDKKDFYSSDPYKNYDFYPMGLGHLTNHGKLREYNLGVMLRNRYDKFLGAIHTPEIVTAMSSDYDRTKTSLLLVLAGLWPPAVTQRWNRQLLWQPIPYSYKTPEDDYFIQRPNSYCPKYLKELEAVLDSDEVHSYMNENEEIIKYIEEWTKKPMKKLMDLFDVYQNLNAEGNFNLTLPGWTKKVYPEPLHTFASKQCYYENSNDVLKRLNGGNALKVIINNSKEKIDGKNSSVGKKVYLFSGHENNIVNILAALDLFVPHVPIYGSAIIIELYKTLSSNNYELRMLYHTQNTTEPQILYVPGCSEYCPFDQFVELTANRVPTNYTAECESQKNLD